jgi:hypothetical protein
MPKLPSTEMTTGEAEGMTGTSEENSKIKTKFPLWSVFIYLLFPKQRSDATIQLGKNSLYELIIPHPALPLKRRGRY